MSSYQTSYILTVLDEIRFCQEARKALVMPNIDKEVTDCKMVVRFIVNRAPFYLRCHRDLAGWTDLEVLLVRTEC